MDSFAAAFDVLPDPFVLLEPIRDRRGAIVDFRLAEANRRALERAGARGSDVRGRMLRALFPGCRPVLAVLVKAAACGQPTEREVEIPSADGVSCWRLQMMPVERGLAVLARDVTTTRERSAHLAQAERLTTLGTMVAGIAHEINNPLAYVLASLELLDDDLAGMPETTRALVRDAREGAERVRQIARGLKVFAASGSAPPAGSGTIDVIGAVEIAARITGHQVRQRARLALDLTSVPVVRGDSGQLVQVLVNLLVNAAQAIPAGQPEVNEVCVRTATTRDGNVRIEVSDTGSGLPRAQRGRIFDPFFTTKEGGTGLGLSISRELVAAMGGSIDVRPAPTTGTVFCVDLPADRQSAFSQAPSGVRAAARPRPRGHVLIIEDDPLVATALGRALSADHDIEVAEDGQAALARLDRDAPFDAIVCDLSLPCMTGAEVHARVHARDADLARRMVFVTGGASTAAAARFLEQVDNPRMQKPFAVQELRELLGALVAEHQGTGYGISEVLPKVTAIARR